MIKIIETKLFRFSSVDCATMPTDMILKMFSANTDLSKMSGWLGKKYIRVKH